MQCWLVREEKLCGGAPGVADQGRAPPPAWHSACGADFACTTAKCSCSPDESQICPVDATRQLKLHDGCKEQCQGFNTPAPLQPGRLYQLAPFALSSVLLPLRMLSGACHTRWTA